MALTRDWTDPRDGKLWMLSELGVDQTSVLLFIRSGERRTALLDRQADLSSFTDKELEALLDQAQMVH